MNRHRIATLAAFAFIALGVMQAQSGAPTEQLPPKTWVDNDTGHRVWRISDEPNSGAYYFNVNAYTPDHKQMVYNSPEGIRVLDLATMETKMLVPNPPPPANAHDSPIARFGRGARAIVVGHKTNSVFFTRIDPATRTNTLYKADTNTGVVCKLIDLPAPLSISSINADETLGAGTYNESDVPGGDPNAPNGFVANAPPPPRAANANAAANLGGAHVQADDKGQMMERRLAARIPLVLFTIRIEAGPNGEKPGTIKPLLHSTDWVNHLLFSPTDPTLLMYCHEGMWQKVDRIWLIHTDGTHNTLIHKRTMAMEIAGHEFWGLDGKTIWYDWQYPKGEDFFLASYNLETGKRTAYHMQRNEWSIHFNLTKDLDLFTGDGGDSGQVAQAPDGQWIELFYPHMIPQGEGALSSTDFFQPGVFKSEHLVNMSHHNYRAEPNVRFTPDKKIVFFTSNMFGPSYIFGVEVTKAINPPAAEIQSTPDLARKYNPVEPTATTTEK
ncbi:MAG TPA: oligogalacturonate lyase family protein [Edaphobacter sp.]|nr:oligogalacturonate lyase family protein [Edaphobacter sp.]